MDKNLGFCRENNVIYCNIGNISGIEIINVKKKYDVSNLSSLLHNFLILLNWHQKTT